MKMFRRVKSWFFLRFTTKNCMDCKSLKQWKKLVGTDRSYPLIPCILFYIVLRGKDLSSLDGKIKVERNEVEQDVDTINLHKQELLLLMLYRYLERNFLLGNPSEVTASEL